jgi:quinoprotein glucose dehydrogenase
MTFPRILCVISIALALGARAAQSAPGPDVVLPDTGTPNWEQADKDATAIKPASGLKLTVFAAEPQLVSPVAIDIDYKGRLWVCETFRFRSGENGGVYDIRNIYDRLEDDLSCQSVADRLAMVKRWEHGDLSSLTRYPDRLSVIEDRDHDGRADHAHVFATFQEPMDGLGAGVLVRRNPKGGPDDIYYADIPNLWLLHDRDGDGKMDEKTSLSYGYGVLYNLIGQDLHGLRFGPDGKLYFSLGDRGMNVTTKEGKTIKVTESGCVLRCDPDGSNLELFHTGLRNPQEIDFDDYGNLFTGDNNCDYGDPGRWVYIVEGGDTGWRIGYKHIQFPRSTGPGFNEMLWAKEAPGNAAYLLPPIEHISTGPSGMRHYPGVGLPERYKDHFFLCDFRAGAASVIHSFKMKPKGASFELVRDRQPYFLEHANATDIDFGPDCAAYVADWMPGFDRKNQARIYRITSKDDADSPLVQETHRLLSEGMTARSETELVTLLAHADQRVRQEAQFELARRGETSIPLLQQCAAGNSNQLARLHAIWGLGMIARKAPTALDPIVKLIDDTDEHVRSQAIKVLGEAKIDAAYAPILQKLNDSSARVRFFAAMALGKFDRTQSINPLLAMLIENADKDAYLRHAGVMGLVGSADGDVLMAAAKNPSASARMAVCLALRKEGDAKIATFLNDSDPLIVLEAARAINDAPINDAMPELAKLIDRPNLSVPLAHRALNANFRVGRPENAKALAAFAERDDQNELMRVEALNMLKMWGKPPGLDRVLGTWRPLPPRDATVATAELKRVVPQVMMSAPDKVRIAAIDIAKDVSTDDQTLLFNLATSKNLSPDVAAAALGAMAEQHDPKLDEAVDRSLKSDAPAIRAVAIKQLARRPDAAPRLEKILKSGTIADQQAVLAALGKMQGNADAERILSQQIDALLAGHEPDPIQLDALEAAEALKSDALNQKIEQYHKSRRKMDLVASHHEELFGGDADAGRHIFFERTDVSCLRCHKMGAQGGGIVGPDLSGIGSRHDRAYILESILNPNAKIAAGFEAVAIKLKDGKTYNGVVKSETDSELVLDTADATGVKLTKSEIVSREKGLSPMPQNIAKPLNKRDLRNLIEFPAQQKQPTTTQSAAK